MKIIFILLLFIISNVLTQETKLCDEMNGNLEVRQSFRWGSDLVVVLNNYAMYRLEDIVFTDGVFRFSKSTEVKLWDISALKKLRLMFTIDYNNTGNRLIAIELIEKEGIEQLVGYVIKISDSFSVESSEEFNINIYRYVPNEEPMNFMSLFAKFPQEDIETHITSISSFPNTQQSLDLPFRLFTYYIETPPKRKQNDCKDCYSSERYIFVKEMLNYVEREEANWRFDDISLPCTDLNGTVINASTPLTDYIAKDSEYYFDSIEFFGKQYNIFRVSVNKNVSKFVEYIKSGTISQLFCTKEVITTTTPPSTTIESTTTSTETTTLLEETTDMNETITSSAPNTTISVTIATPLETTLLTSTETSIPSIETEIPPKESITSVTETTNTSSTSTSTTTPSSTTPTMTSPTTTTTRPLTTTMTTISSTNRTTTKPPSSGLSGGLIFVIILIFVVLLAIVLAIIYFFILRDNTRTNEQNMVSPQPPEDGSQAPETSSEPPGGEAAKSTTTVPKQVSSKSEPKTPTKPSKPASTPSSQPVPSTSTTPSSDTEKYPVGAKMTELPYIDDPNANKQ